MIWHNNRVKRLASLVHAPDGAGVTNTFGCNPASQIATRSRDNDAYAWNGYVPVSRAYAVNGLNQYTSAGPATFGYDANGNLTSDGTTSYVYDAENRLVWASNGTTLSYDPLGRLDAVTKAGATTRFTYDGDQLTLEHDGSGTLVRRYVHGDGADDPQVWYEGSGVSAPRYLYADHQGSVTAVADANGTALAINAYDDYGIPKATNLGRFGYTGQAWLAELGLWYYKTRIYSPTLGRFLQVDPIGYDDQVNLYAYVGNDPVNGIDSTGMAADGEVLVRGVPNPNTLLFLRLFLGVGSTPAAALSYFLNGQPTACVRAEGCRLNQTQRDKDTESRINKILQRAKLTTRNGRVVNYESGGGEQQMKKTFRK